MLFSLLIANYNNGKYISECLSSIKNQTYDNWEVIVVDDNSTDFSLEILEKYTRQDNRFKLYQNKDNRGCGFSKNKCAEYANGEILGFLDPDDSLTPDALEQMVGSHKLNGDVSIITSKYKLINDKNDLISICEHAGSIPYGESYLSSGKPLLTHFATFKKKYYEQTSKINPRLKRAVDQDLYLKMEEVGKHLYVDKVLYNYRAHENNLSRNKNSLKAEFWHLKVIDAAFKRRLSNSSEIPNINRRKLKTLKSNYYIKKMEELESTNNFKIFYLFILALLSYPQHRFKTKVRKLF